MMIVSPDISLLSKAERPTMEVSHLWILATEVFKTIKSSNPDFMYTYLKKDSHFAWRKNDLVINRAKTATFGEKSLRTLGPKIWNSLPEDFKDLTSLQKFTEFIKTWYEPECKCSVCKYSGDPYHYTWTSQLSLNISYGKSQTQYQQTKHQT